MGGKSSKGASRRRSIPDTPVTSSSYAQTYPAYEQPRPNPQPYSPYPTTSGPSYGYNAYPQNYQACANNHAPNYASHAHQKKFQDTYSRIADNYSSLEDVTRALADAGLESSNLIVGIDFTKSNEWTGKNSFNRQSLHHISSWQNPYEQALSIIGRTLSSFDDDNLIPCFGFGDASTHDENVFSFYPDERPCNGFEEALSRYKEIAPQLRLAGPTSFAPIIEMAMTIVEQSGGQYHVLLIIADGQVTRSVDTAFGRLSSQEQKTIDAIVQASQFPLSIVFVGVGDGPWDMMKEFDDNIPARSFDNFQFVNFTEIMLKAIPQTRKETEFALAALMEIPTQYRATLELGILGRKSGKSQERFPLPTPSRNYGLSGPSLKTSESTSFQKSAPTYHNGYGSGPSPISPLSTARSDSLICVVCLAKTKDMAFSCGHQTCCDCGQALENCPICRNRIHVRIKLY